jgi:hypothetical protein
MIGLFVQYLLRMMLLLCINWEWKGGGNYVSRDGGLLASPALPAGVNFIYFNNFYPGAFVGEFNSERYRF